MPASPFNLAVPKDSVKSALFQGTNQVGSVPPPLQRRIFSSSRFVPDHSLKTEEHPVAPYCCGFVTIKTVCESSAVLFARY